MMENDTASQGLSEQEATRAVIRLLFPIAYSLLFLLGTIGNGCVIIMLLNVFTQMRNSTNKRLNSAGSTHVFIYVLGLSVVDFLVIVHLPMLIFDIVEGEWVFGLAMCKLYWVGESVNKLLSSFLMTVLSWDRYLAVCAPMSSFKYRNNTVAVLVLIMCVLTATALLYPVLSESTVEVYNSGPGEGAPKIHKCVFPPTHKADSSLTFLLYTFVAGFIAPALLISYFYLNVIRKVRHQTLGLMKETTVGVSQRLHKVTQRIVTVVVFYFFCWTPYWVFNILLQLNFFASLPFRTISLLFFFAHLLVCFNSAANPILYALINRELRQQHAQALQKRRKSQPTNVATSNSNEKLSSTKEWKLMAAVRRHTMVFERNRSNGSIDSKVLVTLETAHTRCSLPQGRLSLSLAGIRHLVSSSQNGGRHVKLKKADTHEPERLTSVYSQPSLSAETVSVLPEDPSSQALMDKEKFLSISEKSDEFL